MIELGLGCDEAPDEEAAQRVREAARADGDPARLRALAADPNILVRAAVAMNPGCSSDVERALAADADDRVRALLGGRIAKLLPGLETKAQAAAAQHVRSLLLALARDEAVRVRATIAGEIQTMREAPHELVLLLAGDGCVEVSGPLLRLSPVLTDADLLHLLATPPFPQSGELIAARPALSAEVADAVVAYADAPAIRALLANASACIQEATLDALVGRAPLHEEWHESLARRPNLSAKAAQSLSEFIASDLLRVLAARNDLDRALIDGIRRRVAEVGDPEGDRALLVEALRLKTEGASLETAILEAARLGQTRRLAANLAVAASVPLSQVDRIAELRSAKGLVSLSWAGGLSMRVATIVQSHLGHIDPDRLLLPTPGGGFPLTTEEMEWQHELIRDDRQDPQSHRLARNLA